MNDDDRVVRSSSFAPGAVPVDVTLILLFDPAGRAAAEGLAAALSARAQVLALPAIPDGVAAGEVTTLQGIAKRLAAEVASSSARYALLGLGQAAGLVACALAGELLGQDRVVEAVWLATDVTDLPPWRDDNLPDPGDVGRPMIWNPAQDARLIAPVPRGTVTQTAAWTNEQVDALVSAPAGTLAPSMLVPLRPGTGQGGHIFCVPGAGASVISFLDLTQAIPEGAAIHGLQPRGLDGGDPPYTTVEAVARALGELLVARVPVGPVHLVGHSFGGCIAFAIALMLQAKGRAVASLSLIDSGSPRPQRWPAEYDDRQIALRWIRMNEQAAQRSLAIDERSLSPVDMMHNLRLIHAGMVRVQLIPAGTPPSALIGPMRMFEACVRTWYHTDQVYPGPVNLIYLDDPHADIAANARAAHAMRTGWTAVAPQLVFRRGSGNHMTGLKHPHAATLAELIGFGRPNVGVR